MRKSISAMSIFCMAAVLAVTGCTSQNAEQNNEQSP